MVAKGPVWGLRIAALSFGGRGLRLESRSRSADEPTINEIAQRDQLTKVAPQIHARIIVSAGHIHNYERRTEADVLYLVSSGGGG